MSSGALAVAVLMLAACALELRRARRKPPPDELDALANEVEDLEKPREISDA